MAESQDQKLLRLKAEAEAAASRVYRSLEVIRQYRGSISVDVDVEIDDLLDELERLRCVAGVTERRDTQNNYRCTRSHKTLLRTVAETKGITVADLLHDLVTTEAQRLGMGHQAQARVNTLNSVGTGWETVKTVKGEVMSDLLELDPPKPGDSYGTTKKRKRSVNTSRGRPSTKALRQFNHRIPAKALAQFERAFADLTEQGNFTKGDLLAMMISAFVGGESAASIKDASGGDKWFSTKERTQKYLDKRASSSLHNQLTKRDGCRCNYR